MTTKIDISQIDTSSANAGQVLAVQAGGALTFSSSVAEAAGVVKISSVQIADASYTALDDTAVSTSGGFIIINGLGFASGCQVTIGTVPATSVTFISSTQIRAEVPAQAAGSYTLYVINTDGGITFKLNGLTYSVFPTWATGSSLTTQPKNVRFVVNLSANSDSNITYSLVSGSSLPFGANLFANGLIVANVNVANDTTYNFVVAATDQEMQNTNRQFSLTILNAGYNNATGGTVTEVVEGDGKTYRIHTFTSSNSFVVSNISSANGNAEIMIVAGGGAGGARHGGGGGAGGMIGPRFLNLSQTTYTITIGAGGSGILAGGGATLNGSNSFIGIPSSNIFIAVGGGGGNHRSLSAPAPLQQDGRPGGSGGGSGYGGSTAGANVAGQGTPGINFPYPAVAQVSNYPGSGGGGAGGQSNNGYGNFGKHGAYSSISGSNVAYAGGGGGGYYDTVPATTLASGGIGGGGVGYPSSYPGGYPAIAPQANGATNKGGGGGGAGTETQGGNGGSGIVIIKYPITGTF